MPEGGIEKDSLLFKVLEFDAAWKQVLLGQSGFRAAWRVLKKSTPYYLFFVNGATLMQKLEEEGRQIQKLHPDIQFMIQAPSAETYASCRPVLEEKRQQGLAAILYEPGMTQELKVQAQR